MSSPATTKSAARADWVAHSAGGDDVMIACDPIIPSPDQTRVDFDPEYIKELARSIETNGQLNPIFVWRRPDGGIEMVAGECRLRAIRDELGRSEIRARFVEGTAKERAIICGIENLDRRELNPMETARYYVRLRDVHGMKATEIMANFGKSDFTIFSHLGVVDELPSEVHALITSRELAINAAYNQLVKPLRAHKLERSQLLLRAREIIQRKRFGASPEERAVEGARAAKGRKAKQPEHQLRTLLGFRARANVARTTIDSILVAISSDHGLDSFRRMVASRLSDPNRRAVAADFRWIASACTQLARAMEPLVVVNPAKPGLVTAPTARPEKVGLEDIILTLEHIFPERPGKFGPMVLSRLHFSDTLGWSAKLTQERVLAALTYLKGNWDRTPEGLPIGSERVLLEKLVDIRESDAVGDLECAKFMRKLRYTANAQLQGVDLSSL